MRKFIFITLILTISTIWAVRFYHDTRTVQLRVDDQYPGGFVEFSHKYRDFLWRSFIGMKLSEGIIYYGRAYDVAECPLSESNLWHYSDLEFENFWDVKYDTLTASDSTDSIVIDSIFLGVESHYSFAIAPIDPPIIIDQWVNSKHSNENYINVRWIINNVGSVPYEHIPILIFADFDMPTADPRDDIPFLIDGHYAAGIQANNMDSICAGIVLLSQFDSVFMVNTLDWFIWDAVGWRTVEDLEGLIDGDFWFESPNCSTRPCKTWIDSLIGDVGVGFVVNIPHLHSDEACTIDFAFVAAGTPETLISIIAEIDSAMITEHVFHKPEEFSLATYPNPFNSSCLITAPKGSVIEIYDLSGKFIVEGIAPMTWHPTINISTGMYFVRAIQANRSTVRKVIYLK